MHVEVRGFGSPDILRTLLSSCAPEWGLLDVLLNVVAQYSDESPWLLASEPSWLPSLDISDLSTSMMSISAAECELSQQLAWASISDAECELWQKLRACPRAVAKFPTWSFPYRDQPMLDLLGWMLPPLSDDDTDGNLSRLPDDTDADLSRLGDERLAIARQRGIPDNASDGVRLLHLHATEAGEHWLPVSHLSLSEIDLDANPRLAWYDPNNEPRSLPSFRLWVRGLRQQQLSLAIPDAHIRIVYWMS
jgi:hypothetical protein